MNNFTNSATLSQLPGILMYMNKLDHLNYCNDRAAFLLGFDKSDQLQGIHISEIRCKAAECTDIFSFQNKQVIEKNSALKILDIHPYRNNDLVMMLTNKSPQYDTNGCIMGVMMNSIEITDKNFLNIILAIAKLDKQYNRNNITQRSYKITNQVEKTKLSPRELECLFYFVRGKTAKDISNILFISKRTVETHIANIKNKFECKNKSDLIEKIVDNNFINLIPDTIFKRANINLSIII